MLKLLKPVLFIIVLFVLLGAAFYALDTDQKPQKKTIHTENQETSSEEIISDTTRLTSISPKINGVCFVGGRRVIDGTAFEPVKSLGAGWVCFMPYAFSRKDSAKLWYDVKRQWWGEKTAGVLRSIQLAREKGFKVMIKPHLWISWSGFTGHFGYENEKRWEYWEKDYETYILHYAKLADSLEAELFCMGTELERFTQERPQFWQQLIKKVRSVYTGKITYAANWDEYSRFPFWKELDYIGVDAYFPLSEEEEPNIKTLVKAWDKTHQELEAFSKQYKKPILFTEFGYRSVAYCTQRPWESYRELDVNMQTQVVALEALFQKFSTANWYAGGFVWKWFDNHENSGGSTNAGYTPQNKPAEKVIKKWYQKMQ